MFIQGNSTLYLGSQCTLGRSMVRINDTSVVQEKWADSYYLKECLKKKGKV